VLDALEARELRGRDHGGRAQYECPCHDDRTPSLSITDRPDRALVWCHGGCSTLDVLQALDLDWRDLFDEPVTSKGWSNETLRRAGASANGNGRVTLGSVEYLPGATNGERKTVAAAGTARDLWPDPASVAGDPLYVVEGEPDRVSAVQLGLPAVAIPGTGKWDPAWADRLAAGRQRVVVIGDADAPGRRAAQKSAAAIAGHCPDVRVLDLAPERDDGYDLGDLVAEAHGPDDIAGAAALIVRAAELATPIAAPAAPGGREQPAGAGAPREALAAARVDLVQMIREGIPEREYIPGCEGWLIRGKRYLVFSVSGTGKSLAWLAVAVEIVAHGGTVVIIDVENGGDEYARRLECILRGRDDRDALAAARSERLAYYAFPALRLEWTEADWTAALEPADVVVFDSSRLVLSSVGLAEDSNDDYARFMVRAPPSRGRLWWRVPVL
jgi:AAA domain/Toprim-like